MDKLFAWGNLHRGPLTSLLGLIIIVASLVSVFSHGRTWSEAAAGFAVGLGLLGMKDPNSGTGATGVVGGAVVLASFLAFGGCVSQKRLLAKYGTQNPPVTLAITERVPVAIATKPDSLTTVLSLDSLDKAPVGKPINLVSAGGQVTLTLVKTPPGKHGGGSHLQARVKVPPQVVHDTVKVTLYGQCPPTYTLAYKPNRIQRIWHGYQGFCTTLVSISFFVALILLAFRFGWLKFLKFLPFVGVLVLASSSGLASCRSQAVPYRFAPHQPSYLKMPLPRPVHRPRIHY